MQSAASRYGLTQLGHDYVKMRNDIVHEGKLSGANLGGRSKADCAAVVADAVNWLDNYVLAVLGVTVLPTGLPRWNANSLVVGLPALTVK